MELAALLACPLWLPPVALGLDMVMGDPRSLPHPVQAIGWSLDRLEVRARSAGTSRFAGVVCLVCLLSVVGVAGILLLSVPWFGMVSAVWLAWSGLALGSLLRECGTAAQLVAASESSLSGETALAEARCAVGMLVSRDVSQASQPELYRALAETLAENMNDGVVAPFFWLLLGGPVGLWMYKAVSTMDSMWGYTTPKWRLLGWAGARLDDVLAFVPARLAAAALLLSAPRESWELKETRYPGQGALRNFWLLWRQVSHDARTMDSPNAGWPMAAAAWTHGRRMGGPTMYFGAVKNKPVLGPRANTTDAMKVWDAEGLDALLCHVRNAAVACAVCLWGMAVIVRVF